MATLLKDLFSQSIDFLTQQNLFYGHGVEQAEDEVLLLLMHVLQVDFAELNQMSEVPVPASKLDDVQVILKQRVAEKTPMAYLVGFAIYAGLKFNIDQRALIPRSPFVELIDGGFAPWVEIDQVHKVMDLCTGSGCIGLAIAHYFPDLHVDLVDLSSEALSLAEENRLSLNLAQRSHCIESDLFDEINDAYDLIVSNPPYVAEDEYLELPDEYAHEPRMALVSDRKGMEIPVKILFQAADYLTFDGCLFLEVGYNDELLEQCLPNVPFEWVDLSVGGQGICVFTRADLLKYRSEFNHFLKSHVT